MGTRFQQLKERAAERDKAIDRAKVAGHIQQPIARRLTVEEMAEKIQLLEAFKSGVAAGNKLVDDRPGLVVPTQDGQLLSAAMHTMNERKREAIPNVLAEKRWFEQQLALEPTEEVTNFLDEDYRGVINMVGYVVPARSTKRLPKTLAEKFRHKMSLLDRNEKFEQRTGAYDGPGAAPLLGFNYFRKEVLDFDKTEGDIDPGNRVMYF